MSDTIAYEAAIAAASPAAAVGDTAAGALPRWMLPSVLGSPPVFLAAATPSTDSASEYLADLLRLREQLQRSIAAADDSEIAPPAHALSADVIAAELSTHVSAADGVGQASNFLPFR